MKKMKNMLLLMLTFSLSLVLSAQDTLSLEACCQLALEKNKKLAISGENKEKSLLTMKSYRANFLPKLSATGMAYYNSSDMNFNLAIPSIQLFDPSALVGVLPQELLPLANKLSLLDIPDINLNLKTTNSYMGGLTLEQPIYMGGKIRSAYQMSKIGNEIAGLSHQLTTSEVLIETEKAYWLCIQAVELKKSSEKYVEVVEEFHRRLSHTFAEGMTSKNDLMKVQVQLNQAKLQLQRAENSLRLAQMNLCHVIGFPLQQKLIPSQGFSEQQIEVDLQGNVFARPEYQLLDKQVELKAQEKRLTRSEYLPQLGVQGGYNYLYGVKVNDALLFDNGSFSAIASLKVPLFHWASGSRKVKVAEKEKLIMEYQRDYLSEQMQLELQQSINQYYEMLLEVALCEQSLQQSEENLKVSRDHYEVGMEPISDYLEAQTIWQKAQSEHIVAQTKLEIAKSEYLKAAGRK